MAIKPLDDRVLVKPTEAAEKTESGIFLPGTEVDVDGDEGVILRESEILAVLENSK